MFLFGGLINQVPAKSHSQYILFKKHPRPIIEKWYSNKTLIGTQSHTNPGIGIKALPLALQSSKEVHVLVHSALALTSLGPTVSAFFYAVPTTGCLFLSASRFQTYSVCVLCFCPWRCFHHVQHLFLVFWKHVFRTADDFWNKWLSLYLCDFFWFFPRGVEEALCMPLLVSTSYLLMFDIVAIALRLYRLLHYNFVIYSIICPYGLVPVTMQDFSHLEIWQFDSLDLIHLNLIVF